MAEWQPRLLEHPRAETGEHLRSVIHYHGGGYDLLFVRDDVSDAYTEAAVEAVVRGLGVETVEKRIKEELYAHGDLEFTVLRFEEGIELFVHLGERSGVAVGFDPAAVDEWPSCLDRYFGEAEVGG